MTQIDPNESDESAARHDAPSEGESARSSTLERPLEYWVRAAAILSAAFAVAWGLALGPFGETSLYLHIFGIPILGGMTLPVALWGVMRTVFRPPVFRWSRLAGFGLLLTVGYFGNVPVFAAPAGDVDWGSTHDYRLPFDGEWTTLAGGPEVARNYHATTAAYRWGYDFAPTRDGERARSESPDALSEYYCWGEPVVSPAGGEVVKYENDREDFPPREFDESSVFGNHVVVRVDAGEFLYVGHLQEGSVRVEPGDAVERGERLGTCGNSGRAVEPHVHVHLQDRLEFPVARSLPLRFSNYRVAGEGRVDRGMPEGRGSGGEPPGDRVEYLGGG